MRTQQGNVLFLILIAVALFAALSYAVTSSSRSGGSSASAENTNLQASATLQYLTSMRQAIQRMQINGCDETQISFVKSGVGYTGPYTNVNAPVDKRCHIFESAGGGLSLQPVGTLKLSVTAVVVDGIGTDKSDLVFYAHDVGVAYCDILLKQLYGATTNIGDVVPTAVPFNGSYNDPASIAIGDSADSFFKGKPIGCFSDNAGLKNSHLYFVLLER